MLLGPESTFVHPLPYQINTHLVQTSLSLKGDKGKVVKKKRVHLPLLREKRRISNITSIAHRSIVGNIGHV